MPSVTEPDANNAPLLSLTEANAFQIRMAAGRRNHPGTCGLACPDCKAPLKDKGVTRLSEAGYGLEGVSVACVACDFTGFRYFPSAT